MDGNCTIEPPVLESAQKRLIIIYEINEPKTNLPISSRFQTCTSLQRENKRTVVLFVLFFEIRKILKITSSHMSDSKRI
jgi:hypothetical protein